MLREFQLFSTAGSSPVAVKRGFCWPGFFFSWIWAFARGLWIPGSFIFLASALIGFLELTLLAGQPLFPILFSLVLGIIAGIKGNFWRGRKLEREGYRFLGLIQAKSASAAVAAFSAGKPLSLSTKLPRGSFFTLPGSLQKLFAITWLTWKAALRFRLFIVIAVLLLASVVGLPILIKDDGTARGFTQIILTYTLSTITALLGLCTLWLSCGTLARDIEECQMQVVAVKPIARWQIWLGKWLGIVTLNAALLALSGACVYGLLQWRATKLPPKEQEVLRNEVLVSRAALRESGLMEQIQDEADRIYQQRINDKSTGLDNLTEADRRQVHKQILEQVKAGAENVPPGSIRPWHIDLGLQKNSLRGRPLQLRVKFNAAEKSPSGTFDAFWQIGVPPNIWRNEEPMSLAPDTFHEFDIPADLMDENGILTVVFYNPNNTTLLFPLNDGMEVLYRESGFGLNFARGLGIILCWMALLSALGLASASFLSFPVAAFFSLGLLTVALSSGTMANVVSEGTVLGGNSETGQAKGSLLDFIVIPAFRAALSVINLAKQFSPIDSLSSGRSISWSELGMAFSQIVLLLGGAFALFGIIVFTRRELATAQGNQ